MRVVFSLCFSADGKCWGGGGGCLCSHLPFKLTQAAGLFSPPGGTPGSCGGGWSYFSHSSGKRTQRHTRHPGVRDLNLFPSNAVVALGGVTTSILEAKMLHRGNLGEISQNEPGRMG